MTVMVYYPSVLGISKASKHWKFMVWSYFIHNLCCLMYIRVCCSTAVSAKNMEQARVKIMMQLRQNQVLYFVTNIYGAEYRQCLKFYNI